MAKLPPPPATETLQRVRLDTDVVALAPMTPLARIYSTARGATWRTFRRHGPVATARFDPHPEGEPQTVEGCGVLYAALSLQTCIAEVFQSARTVDVRSAQPWLVVFRLRRVVRLLDLSGTWPTRAGASQAISSGPRDVARAWARAVFTAYDDVEGLWYPSSMNAGEPSVCLWERAEDALPESPDAVLPLDAPALALPLARACAEIGYRLV